MAVTESEQSSGQTAASTFKGGEETDSDVLVSKNINMYLFFHVA